MAVVALNLKSPDVAAPARSFDSILNSVKSRLQAKLGSDIYVLLNLQGNIRLKDVTHGVVTLTVATPSIRQQLMSFVGDNGDLLAMWKAEDPTARKVVVEVRSAVRATKVTAADSATVISMVKRAAPPVSGSTASLPALPPRAYDELPWPTDLRIRAVADAICAVFFLRYSHSSLLKQGTVATLPQRIAAYMLMTHVTDRTFAEAVGTFFGHAKPYLLRAGQHVAEQKNAGMPDTIATIRKVEQAFQARLAELMAEQA